MMLETFLKPATLLFALLAVSALTPVNATNSDVAKESRWAEQEIDGLLDGDEHWLIDDIGHEFLSILTEGDKSSGRAVVLVHGIGVYPNWPDVIYPLRAGLLEQGITTLSLQMPILANDADEREYGLLFPEVPGRFESCSRLPGRRGLQKYHHSRPQYGCLDGNLLPVAKRCQCGRLAGYYRHGCGKRFRRSPRGPDKDTGSGT